MRRPLNTLVTFTCTDWFFFFFMVATVLIFPEVIHFSFLLSLSLALSASHTHLHDTQGAVSTVGSATVGTCQTEYSPLTRSHVLSYWIYVHFLAPDTMLWLTRGSSQIITLLIETSERPYWLYSQSLRQVAEFSCFCRVPYRGTQMALINLVISHGYQSASIFLRSLYSPRL